jgi:4a-hydroxytetrahydrobiopterin dehydratase
MSTSSVEELYTKKCSACEGGLPKLNAEEIGEHLQAVDAWRITGDGLRIRKDWQMKGFQAGIDFYNRVAQIAEDEGHHPDIHLENYRHAWIEISTHAVGGLTENDFILAAKIDRLPMELKK